MTAEVTLLGADEAHDEAIVEELVRIVNAAYAVGEAGLWLEGTARIRPAEIAEAIRGDGLLAARLDGRLVGCAHVRALDRETADLAMVSSTPDQWGSGVGGELVRSAEELMRSRGATTMQLELLVPKGRVHPAKERLRGWYTRLGYRVVRSAAFEEVAPRLAGIGGRGRGARCPRWMASAWTWTRSADWSEEHYGSAGFRRSAPCTPPR